MKKHTLFIISILIFHLLGVFNPAYAQSRRSSSDITGAWTGYVKTRDKKIIYEAVISRSGTELTGYSKIIFVNKGEETYAIKSLLVKKEDDKYILEEDSLVFDNFLEEAPKKIKQVSTLELQIGSKKMTLSGNFKTKATMGLKSATGEVFLQKAIDPDSSMLFAELGSFGLKDNLSFVIESKEAEVFAAKEKVRLDSIAAVNALAKANTPEPPVSKPAAPAPKPTSTRQPRSAAVNNSLSVTRTPQQANIASTRPTVPTSVNTIKPVPQTSVLGESVDIQNRELETIKTIEFGSGMLVFTLYDNGEVDGDTVSVLVNGRVFMGKKGLSTNPVTDTLYITPDLGDSIQVVMYAESLGKIPPNTGLLIVNEGKKRYEIRFSGDLKKNAAITFRKRKQE